MAPRVHQFRLFIEINVSEFSTLTTRSITPALKARGFRKYGRFDRSETHDQATYQRGDIVVTLTLAFHPYDYPEIGIRLRTCDADSVLFDHLYPPSAGGIEEILRAVLKDIESGVVTAVPGSGPDSVNP